jgi:DNA-directed RNA polymerase specialized sigma subunit
VINKTKKYLKNIAKTHTLTETKQIIKKLVEHPDFAETEKWLIYYTYGEGRMVVNTCRKLAISESEYRLYHKMALLKLYYNYLV